MRTTTRRNGYLVTLHEGDYGTEDRCRILKADGARIGRHGRAPKSLRYFITGMDDETRSRLLRDWNRRCA